MNSRLLLNLFLGVLVVGLAMVIVFEPGIEQPEEPAGLSAADPDAVTAISIERTDKDTLRLEQRDDRWFVLRQEAIPASQFQARTLLDLLSAKIERTYNSQNVDRGRLGLEPPRATIRFQPGPVILFGGREALAGLRYVELDGMVHLVSDSHRHLVDGDFTEFVDRRLLGDDARIESLVLPDKTLQRAGDVQWAMTPQDKSVSADAVQQLVDAWRQASALWVRSYEAAETTETVHVMLAGRKEPIEFMLVSREPEWILARPEWDIQYHLTADAGERLFRFAETKPDDAPAPREIAE